MSPEPFRLHTSKPHHNAKKHARASRPSPEAADVPCYDRRLRTDLLERRRLHLTETVKVMSPFFVSLPARLMLEPHL